MNVKILSAIVLLSIRVNSYEIRLSSTSRKPSISYWLPAQNLAWQQRMAILQRKCIPNSMQPGCMTFSTANLKITTVQSNDSPIDQNAASVEANQVRPDIELTRRMFSANNNLNMIASPLYGKLDGYVPKDRPPPVNNVLNMKLDLLPTKQIDREVETDRNMSSTVIFDQGLESDRNMSSTVIFDQGLESDRNMSSTVIFDQGLESDRNMSSTVIFDQGLESDRNMSSTVILDQGLESGKNVSSTMVSEDLDPVADKFAAALDKFESKFFEITFNKLVLLAPPSRVENGLSFVQSGLFLQLALMALATEAAPETRREIEACLGVHFSHQQISDLIDTTLSSLPESGEDLKFRWSTRLVLRSQTVSEQFRDGAAKALRLKVDQFNGTESPKEMADALNHMVEIDTGGAIHDTFEEDELSDDVQAVLVTTLYLRARWRSAPTLLNGSRVFRDSDGAPRRAARMIRLNDLMMYADLPEWDAEALEIPYSRGGLSLLLLVPRGTSLRRLAAAARGGLAPLAGRLRALRLAATLPLYTLRMTLLLPNKLTDLNISRLVSAAGAPAPGDLRLSLAVQRVMFWAEAGRNAFKDDGIEWDETPDKEIVVDRPYIFYVRWKNTTIMNGNFVL